MSRWKTERWDILIVDSFQGRLNEADKISTRRWTLLLNALLDLLNCRVYWIPGTSSANRERICRVFKNADF